MNCDDLLVGLESDDDAEREAAIAHAAECAACAAAAEQWRSLRAALGTLPTTSPEDREAWVGSTEPAVAERSPGRAADRGGLTSSIVAALLVASVFLFWRTPEPPHPDGMHPIVHLDEGARGAVVVDPPRPAPPEVVERFDLLLGEIEEMEREIDQLADATRRASIVRQIDRELAEFDSWSVNQ